MKLNLSADAMVYGQIETAGNGISPMVCNLVSGVKTMGSLVQLRQTIQMEYPQNIIEAAIAPDHQTLKLRTT